MENIQTGKYRPAYTPQGLCEYLLIVRPARELYDMLLEEKMKFSRQYRQSAAEADPYILVSKFAAWDSMEDSLIRSLQRIMREQAGFSVTLNNYSGVPCHTVFVRILDPSPFRELSQRLKALAPYIKESNSPSGGTYQPRLKIAGRLSSEVYEDAIREYARKDFHGSFEVSHLVLLRRQEKDDRCREIAVFRLQPNQYTN